MLDYRIGDKFAIKLIRITRHDGEDFYHFAFENMKSASWKHKWGVCIPETHLPILEKVNSIEIGRAGEEPVSSNKPIINAINEIKDACIKYAGELEKVKMKLMNGEEP